MFERVASKCWQLLMVRYFSMFKTLFCQDILGSFRFYSYLFWLCIGCILVLLLTTYQSYNLRDMIPRIRDMNARMYVCVCVYERNIYIRYMQWDNIRDKLFSSKLEKKKGK